MRGLLLHSLEFAEYFPETACGVVIKLKKKLLKVAEKKKKSLFLKILNKNSMSLWSSRLGYFHIVIPFPALCERPEFLIKSKEGRNFLS